MKKFYLLVPGLLLGIGISTAQVGINIKDSDKILHVDPLGNTSGSTNITDDVIIDKSASGSKTGVSIGIGGNIEPNASITLQATDMGFLPNRVALTGTKDGTTVPSPEEGMVVYNTATQGIPPYDVKPGYYVYDGSTWQYTTTTAAAHQKIALSEAVSTKPSNGPSDLLNVNTLKFVKDINIEEDGAYGFILNFKGTTSPVSVPENPTMGRCVFYVYLFREYKDAANVTQQELKDMVELNPPFFNTGSDRGAAITFTTPMASEFKADDKIVFKISRFKEAHYPEVTLATGNQGTVLTYWKLQ